MVDFSKLSPEVRDIHAEPGSQAAVLLALPQQRKYTHDLKGKLLYFPRTDQVMVPYDMAGGQGGGWNVVVVFNGERAPRHDGTRGWAAGTPVYPPNGHSLFVSDLEMQTAIELTAEQKFALEVRTATAQGPIEVPAASFAQAMTLAGMNGEHEVKIIQSISFEPCDAWEVLP